jgi:hypothetical protein
MAGFVFEFDRTSPVTRYWLAHCEGFAVRGATRGTVRELVCDDDELVPYALVVRRRARRPRRVDASAVAAVVPAERLLILERKRRRPLPRPRLPHVPRPPVAAVARPVLTEARRRLEPVALYALASFRRLAAEALGAALGAERLLRSDAWRRSVRSARSATTSTLRALSTAWSRRRTT